MEVVFYLASEKNYKNNRNNKYKTQSCNLFFYFIETFNFNQEITWKKFHVK